MAGDGLSRAERWLEAESAGAPAPLRDHAAGYLHAQRARQDPAEALAAAAAAALAVVLSYPAGDRAAARDLLAADALLTLALKTRAEQGPESLARFARELRRRGAADGGGTTTER